MKCISSVTTCRIVFGTLILTALLSGLPAGTAGAAALRLPAVFADHAVLQRNAPVPVWGWAEPGEMVTVAIAGQTATATADAAGRWRVDWRRCPPEARTSSPCPRRAVRKPSPTC